MTALVQSSEPKKSTNSLNSATGEEGTRAPLVKEVVYGHVIPRVFTPPLVTGPPGPCGCGCALTPDTSYGFDVVRFADNVVKMPLRPWQRWVVIHGGELLADGTPRFEQVLLLVARQNGKTHLLSILIMYWMFVEQIEEILGISTTLGGARIPWLRVAKVIDETPKLSALMPRTKNKGIYMDNNDPKIVTAEGCYYRLAPANRGAARGRTVWRLLIDELREQQTREAYDALIPTMQAIDWAQCYFLSNQGDDKSVVLNDLYDAATAYIEGNTEERDDMDDSFAMFEYSAPKDCDIFDVEAWRHANPSLGYTTKLYKRLHNKAKLARSIGQAAENGFRTEYLCQRVASLDSAVNAADWNRCEDPSVKFGEAKSRVAFCFDISQDDLHATLVAAAVLSDGRVRITEVKTWEGKDLGMKIRLELPGLANHYRVQKVGWFPGGKAAILAATVRPRQGVKPWLPPSIGIEEIRGEVTDACMSFSNLVSQLQVVHEGQALLTTHVLSASMHEVGDKWRFLRKGGGHCDGAYAAAGAVYLAQTLPQPVGKPRVLYSDND